MVVTTKPSSKGAPQTPHFESTMLGYRAVPLRRGICSLWAAGTGRDQPHSVLQRGRKIPTPAGTGYPAGAQDIVS